VTPPRDCERSKFKKFFFEKKNQKTFLLRFAWCWKRPRQKINKVFLLLFVHKKKFFLPLPSLFDLSGPLALLKQ